MLITGKCGDAGFLRFGFGEREWWGEKETGREKSPSGTSDNFQDHSAFWGNPSQLSCGSMQGR